MAMPPRKIQHRDPDRTRARILEAAFAEFARKGFAGARVDAIARRARTNKRMLYHYFSDKEGLFGAVLRKKMRERLAPASRSPEEFIAHLPKWFADKCADAPCREQCSPLCAGAWFALNHRDKDWVRVLAWEALQAMDGGLAEIKHRRKTYSEALAQTRLGQARRKVNPDHPPEFLHLAMISLAMFPVALPQIAKLVIGRDPNDAKFLRDYSEFLKQFASGLRPSD
jgi:AcrR family transcriptional regulator